METTEEDCIKCKRKISEDEIYYYCDSCLRRIHKECLSLSASEDKCMPLRKRMLLYICNDCRALMARIPYMMKVLDEMKKDIAEIKEKQSTSMRSDNNYKGMQQKTYADALAPKRPLNTDQTIIIKAKNNKEAGNTIKIVQENLNPSELNIRVKKVRSTKNGDIVINCPTRDEGEILKRAAMSKLSDRCSIETIKKRPTRLKIVGVEENQNQNPIEVEDALRKQNTWIDTNDKLTITYIKKIKKNNTLTIYLECSARLFHKAIEYKKVYLGWQRYPVYEDLSVQRCFTCQGFFHKNTSCENPVVCVNCSGDHDVGECPGSVRKCNNCLLANKNFSTNYNSDHAANDISCPAYQYYISCLRNKIDYGS